MEGYLFNITCTTCQARLAVRDVSAIGAILACPKCASMVHIQPPKDWVPQPELMESLAETPFDPVDRYIDRTRAPTAEPETISGVFASLPPGAARPGKAKPPPLPAGAAKTASPALPPEASPVGAAELQAVSAVPRGRRWAVWGSAAAAGVLVVALAWSLAPSRSRPAAEPPQPAEGPALPLVARLREPVQPEASLPWEQQWLPAQTQWMFTARLAAWLEIPATQRWIEQAQPLWQSAIAGPLEAFGLKASQVERLVWAGTDLRPGLRPDLLVIQRSAAAGPLTKKALPAGFALKGTACQRLEDPAWPHPFALVDAQTIVTGREALLRELAARPDRAPASAPLRKLLAALPRDAALGIRLDLGAARAAGWSLPGTWADVWPEGREAWHAVCEVPDGLGLAIEAAEPARVHAALACEGPSAAERLAAFAHTLLDEGQNVIAARLEALTGKLQQGEISAAAAGPYELVLRDARTALGSAQVATRGEVVTARFEWELTLPALAKAGDESRPTLQADWLAAALRADDANHQRILAGLGGYQRAEGSFPGGAAGGSLLPPETRLSWLATMLPYFGQTDWHRQLEFSYPWNAPQNRPVTRRTLPAVVNPLLGPGTSEAGFPVTHYVGAAGLGADAAGLPPDDPRAGVFGFGRVTRPEDITDGASCTIAILPVARDAGPWAAGGGPTVRGLTARPYVNGPDGFGSGLPDKMLVGMADGSVRMISQDIDPQVLEQLVTIRGGERVDLASLEPNRVRPAPAPAPPAAAKPAPEPVAVDAPPPAAPAPPIDVRPGLAVAVPNIELKQVPLEDAVSLAAELGHVPVGIDLDALDRLHVKLNDPVSVKLVKTTVAQVLAAVAAARGLALGVDGNRVLVTSPAEEREALRRERYDVADLARQDPKEPARLASAIQELVAPETWHAAGGRGTLSVERHNLFLDQTAAVHSQVSDFCEKLRTARSLPLRGPGEPRDRELTSRRARAQALLVKQVTVTLQQEVPLQRAVGLLREAAGARIVIDWAALTSAGVALPANVRLRVDRLPLATALERLLDPLKLADRIVDADLLEITTRPALAERLELEFYGVSDLLAREPARALIEQIRAHAARDSWTDAGGPGVIRLDEPSQYLLVLQSQSAQAEVEKVLSQLRSAKKPPPRG